MILVVARKKFEAVGGFEENLAIELNDVDLCLRLAERGWRCIADPRVELLHHEGASRSATLLQRFRRNSDHERAFFEPRWRSMIRDDPFYHPALSLHRSQMSLS